MCSNNVRQGGAAVVLKHPQNTQNIRGDGIVAIVAHMRNIQTFIISNGYTSVEQYVSETGMNRTSVWGTEIEILTLAHLLSIPVLVYAAGNWASEASPTLGCSIEISRDIYIYTSKEKSI